jgi:Family of unknown function (DUF5719)
VRAVRLVPAGVVLLALGGVAGAAQLARPAATTASPVIHGTRQVQVTSAVRACPPAQDGPGTIALIAAPGGPAGKPGLAGLAPLPSSGTRPRATGPISQRNPGVLSLLTLPATTGPTTGTTGTTAGGTAKGTAWSVTASDAMAQGMEAEVVQGPGVASVRCGEPASQIWFVGPGPRNGAAQIKLDLMNIDSLTANVDVTIITDAGPVQAGNATGIIVPPHHTVTDSLSAGAAGSTVVAVEVRTTIGRVAADVSEAVSGGAASWLPSTLAPATRLVIPGVPPSGRSAGLFLVVPGGSNARVSVLAITPQGQYRPFGSQTVDLPGESASYVALAPLGGTAAALEITASVPVTAAVLVPGSGAGAFATATAPVSEQAVVAGNVTGSGFAASVTLSAPAGAARVRLTEIAAGAGAAATANRAAATGSQVAATASQTVSVRARHTLIVPATAPLGAKRGSAFSLVITPLAGSGPVYAARVETQGQGTVVSIIPAISALTAISLPPVRDTYDAIAPP